MWVSGECHIPNVCGDRVASGKYPQLVYFTYSVRNAVRSDVDRWANPIDPDQFFDKIEFSVDYATNLKPMDMKAGLKTLGLKLFGK